MASNNWYYIVCHTFDANSCVAARWSTLTVDFVLAYPQGDIENEIYMKLPRGIDFGPKISRLFHFFKLV